MKTLYDGKMTYEVMTEAIGEGKPIGFGQNNLVAREDWFDSHPNEVQFLLALYDEAAKMWNENKPEIIRQFPQEFNVETDEDAQYVIDILEERDFTPDTAYLDEDYVEGEKKILDIMGEVGLLDPEAEQPRFEIVLPE
jgi:ABC-type nitrate/sulfonate/bicarbonate transport system substrate-binding protein